jgi:hypothetical protein
VLLSAAWLSLAGCGGQNVSTAPTQIVCPPGATTANVLQAAEKILTRMQFSIEKLDVDQGIVKTRPLRGGQFFEFWRSDNASPFGWSEANVQSIRRSVELRVVPAPAAADGPPRREPAVSGPVSSGLCLECSVSVQRMNLPGTTLAGTSQVYELRSHSSPTLRRRQALVLRRQSMVWIDLGPDPALAEEILRRIEHRLSRAIAKAGE